MENNYTYTDLWENPGKLTREEISWFHSVCNDCLVATNISVPVYCENIYDTRKGKAREATGSLYTDKPENPLDSDGNTYITVDSAFIHDCYDDKFNGGHSLRFDTLEHVIAHELAHCFQWRHCKKHTRITEGIYGKIKEYQEGKNMENNNIKKNQFATKEAFDNWLVENFAPKTFDEALNPADNTDENKIIHLLIECNYDLENLLADGHAYAIGEYSNGGWYYEDEVDQSYLERTGKKVELRKRTEQ